MKDRNNLDLILKRGYTFQSYGVTGDGSRNDENFSGIKEIQKRDYLL